MRQFTLNRVGPAGSEPVLAIRVDGNRTVGVRYLSEQHKDFAYQLLAKGAPSRALERSVAHTEGMAFVEALQETLARSTYWSIDEAAEPSVSRPRPRAALDL